jgi:hypothetical protein
VKKPHLRPLPETDLARAASLPLDQRRLALERVKFGKPLFSYSPVRSSWPDVLNVQPPLFGPVAPTSREQVERLIRSRATTVLEFKNNIEVAGCMHAHATEAGWRAVVHDIDPLPLGGRWVQYWLRLVLVIDGKLHVPFFDPRRPALRLTVAARRFVFSAMHYGARVADPDLADAALAIFQFDETKTGDGRVLKLHTDTGVEIYSLEDLDRMVAETNAIWRDVLEDREAEVRRRSAGTRGDLL